MLVRRPNGGWEHPPVSAYSSEAELQALIAGSPELISGLEPSAAVALRELAIPDAGSLDVLVVHLTGELTLVEAKLNRNPDIRRAVVGQLLGYAGGLWRMGYERLDAQVRRQHGSSLAELAAAQAGGAPFDPDGFREAVALNLHEGAFRLVFAVDGITEDLRRAVEFLNAHTLDGTQVVVLELGYSKVDDIEILLPRTFGEEAARSKRASRARQRWSEADLLEALDAQGGPEEAEAGRRLYEWALPRAKRLYWGEGQAPSVTMVFDVPEGVIQPCSIYTASEGSNGVAVNFEWMRRRPRAALSMVLDRLQELPTVGRLRDEIVAKDFAKRPTVPLSELTGERMALLLNALEALLDHPVEAVE